MTIFWGIRPALCFAWILPSALYASDYFDPAFLETGGAPRTAVDLSLFENKESQTPGVYRVDLFLNNKMFDTRDITFRLEENAQHKNILAPCLSEETLQSFGVKTAAFPLLRDDTQGCANLSAIPLASSEFDFSEQALRLSIPQAALDSHAHGYIDPARREQGIPGLMLSYNYSGATWTSHNGTGTDSQYLSLRPGLNVGPWRLRNFSTWSNSQGQAGRWESVYTYLQRDISALNSQLIVGDNSSTAEVFDSTPFRGVQLYSDEQMLPGSLRGYAPVIRGIARTNAQITIFQNGYSIYQSYVPPGEFVINDLYLGSSGELKVVVKEADGSEQVSLVPYASLAVMQREGQYKYEVISGSYRSSSSDAENALFSQGSLIYGLPWETSIYGGMQAASQYQSLLFGMGKNMGDFGALSFDITQAWATTKQAEKNRGQSLRLRYNKNLLSTGTNVAIAGYRYSTSDFYTLGETLSSYHSQPSRLDRRRSRTELTLNQNLGENLGYLSAMLVSEDYHTSQKRTISATLGYGNSWNGISYSLNYNHYLNVTKEDNQRLYNQDNLFSLSVSVPLDKWLRSTRAGYTFSAAEKRSPGHSVSLSGSALEDNNLNWSVQQNINPGSQANSSDASLSYNGRYAQVGAGYGYSRDAQRLNYSLRGGVLVHPHGVTLAQSLGETVALVEAPDAAGVSVRNHTGVRTDPWGYAVVPYLTPYQESNIQLRPDTLPDDVELESNSHKVVPTRGAIVRARFTTAVGKRLMMTLKDAQGKPVPFGAIVSQNTTTSIVGDEGSVFLTGMAEKGTLDVSWGKKPDQRCQVHYQLSGQEPTISGIVQLTQTCKSSVNK